MMQDPSDEYPDYSPAERFADGTMHLIGVSLSIIGSILLATLVARTGTLQDMIAVSIYSVAIVFAFLASAAYHMTPWEHLRPLFRRFDHAAIFLKIAGTYTPLVMLIGSYFSYTILAGVWAVALFGVIRRVFYWRAPTNGYIVLYLGLGWASLALAYPMTKTVPAATFWLVIAGGLIYTAGVIFYKWESLRFSNAIWHVFVVVASGCHFTAIFLGELAKQGLSLTYGWGW